MKISENELLLDKIGITVHFENRDRPQTVAHPEKIWSCSIQITLRNKGACSKTGASLDDIFLCKIMF